MRFLLTSDFISAAVVVTISCARDIWCALHVIYGVLCV